MNQSILIITIVIYNLLLVILKQQDIKFLSFKFYQLLSLIVKHFEPNNLDCRFSILFRETYIHELSTFNTYLHTGYPSP